jgi:hypothetical protein
VGELAVPAVVEGPLALADDTAGCVPGVDDVAHGEPIGHVVDRPRARGVADRIGEARSSVCAARHVGARGCARQRAAAVVGVVASLPWR